MQGDIVVELVGSTPSGETWYFNDTIGSPGAAILSVNFTSNGIAYTDMTRMKVVKNYMLVYENPNTGKGTSAYNYNTSKWYNEAYRTIVLDEPATGDVLAFLEANATKLS